MDNQNTAISLIIMSILCLVVSMLLTLVFVFTKSTDNYENRESYDFETQNIIVDACEQRIATEILKEKEEDIMNLSNELLFFSLAQNIKENGESFIDFYSRRHGSNDSLKKSMDIFKDVSPNLFNKINETWKKDWDGVDFYALNYEDIEGRFPMINNDEYSRLKQIFLDISELNKASNDLITIALKDSSNQKNTSYLEYLKKTDKEKYNKIENKIQSSQSDITKEQLKYIDKKWQILNASNENYEYQDITVDKKNLDKANSN